MHVGGHNIAFLIGFDQTWLEHYPFREQEVYRIFNVIGQNAKVPVLFVISFTALLTQQSLCFSMTMT
jgi:hypothetical protein